MSHFSLKYTKNNQLLVNLFDRINDFVHDNLIDLQKSIQIKEQIYFLEDNIDLSRTITFQARLLNSSNENEFNIILKELDIFVHHEQFRLSKAQDLISIWHLNNKKGNSYERQIIKLFHELANHTRLYGNH